MATFADQILQLATEKTHSRYWLISDLQQGDPVFAEKYLCIAMEDMARLNLKLDGICYLGDAAQGIELDAIQQMIRMQVDALDRMNVPVFYVMGNHEFDYYHWSREQGLPPYIPMYEAVKNRPNWHVVPDQETFWFAHETPEFIMLFFSDHAAKDGSWSGTHQILPPDPTPEEAAKGRKPYPYTKADWIAVRDRFANCGKPVFTFAHCAFPGGNRPSQFLEQLLPLPANFRAHIHGHAHIGDGRCAKENLYRQIAMVNDHPVMQYDIASLDHLRGTAVRSAFFDYFGNGEYGIFFRDHLNGRWENSSISTFNVRDSGIPDLFR